MNPRSVTITLQTWDRTRKAQVSVGRDMRVQDLVKLARSKWRLSFGVQMQVVNLNTSRQLSPFDLLSNDLVNNGDVLMLQPLATHGRS